MPHESTPTLPDWIVTEYLEQGLLLEDALDDLITAGQPEDAHLITLLRKEIDKHSITSIIRRHPRQWPDWLKYEYISHTFSVDDMIAIANGDGTNIRNIVLALIQNDITIALQRGYGDLAIRMNLLLWVQTTRTYYVLQELLPDRLVPPEEVGIGTYESVIDPFPPGMEPLLVQLFDLAAHQRNENTIFPATTCQQHELPYRGPQEIGLVKHGLRPESRSRILEAIRSRVQGPRNPSSHTNCTSNMNNKSTPYANTDLHHATERIYQQDSRAPLLGRLYHTKLTTLMYYIKLQALRSLRNTAAIAKRGNISYPHNEDEAGDKEPSRVHIPFTYDFIMHWEGWPMLLGIGTRLLTHPSTTMFQSHRPSSFWRLPTFLPLLGKLVNIPFLRGGF